MERVYTKEELLVRLQEIRDGKQSIIDDLSRVLNNPTQPKVLGTLFFSIVDKYRDTLVCGVSSCNTFMTVLKHSTPGQLEKELLENAGLVCESLECETDVRFYGTIKRRYNNALKNKVG